MNLNHLAIFKAVAEAHGVMRGAERLMISQPAVSKQLKQFERALGVTLFDRLPGRIRLTDAGEVLLTYARRLFAIEAEATQAMDEIRGVKRGRLRIGASMTIGVYLLPQRLAVFRALFPKIELHMEIENTDNIQRMLLDHSLDVAFTEGFVEDPELAATEFATDELVPIAQPGHPLLKKKMIRLEDFLNEPLIAREPGSGTRAVVERTLARHGVTLSPVLSLANTEAIKRTVAAGMGVAIVSRLAIDAEVANKSLAIVPIRGLSIRRPLHVLELKHKKRSPLADILLKLIMQPDKA